MPKQIAQKFSLNYTPNPAQKRFAEAVQSGATVVLFLGGVRSGKSIAGVAEGMKFTFMNPKPPYRGWLVAPTYPLSEVTERMFVSMCTSETGSLILHHDRSRRKYTMRPSAKNPNVLYEIEIKSADNPDSLRGASVNWILLDEGAMMKEMAFRVAQARVMDNKGIILITTTPMGMNWLYDSVYRRSFEDSRYAVVKCTTLENIYLPADEAQALKEDYAAKSKALVDQEMNAEFITFSGRVFDKFSPDTHVMDPRKIYDTLPVYCGIDWGYNDPFVCVWVTQIDGVWVVLDEYYRSRGVLSEHARYIKEHPLAPQVKKYWCDPSDKLNRMEFRKHGIPAMPARRGNRIKTANWPVDRARLINTMFGKRLKSPWEDKQIPGMVFFSNVRWGTKEMMSLCFENTSELSSDRITVYDKDGREIVKNATEKLQDYNNHFTDALGYVMCSQVRVYGGVRAHYYDPGTGKVEVQRDNRSKDQLLHDEIEERFKAAEKAAKKRVDKFQGLM